MYCGLFIHNSKSYIGVNTRSVSISHQMKLHILNQIPIWIPTIHTPQLPSCSCALYNSLVCLLIKIDHLNSSGDESFPHVLHVVVGEETQIRTSSFDAEGFGLELLQRNAIEWVMVISVGSYWWFSANIVNDKGSGKDRVIWRDCPKSNWHTLLELNNLNFVPLSQK